MKNIKVIKKSYNKIIFYLKSLNINNSKNIHNKNINNKKIYINYRINNYK